VKKKSKEKNQRKKKRKKEKRNTNVLGFPSSDHLLLITFTPLTAILIRNFHPFKQHAGDVLRPLAALAGHHGVIAATICKVNEKKGRTTEK
jgi:hypothetical protein